MTFWLIIVRPTEKVLKDMEADAIADGMDKSTVGDYDFIEPFYHYFVVKADSEIGAKQKLTIFLKKKLNHQMISTDKYERFIREAYDEELSVVNRSEFFDKSVWEIPHNSELYRNLLYRT